MIRKYEVAKTKPVTVKVYDYYKPGILIVHKFNLFHFKGFFPNRVAKNITFFGFAKCWYMPNLWAMPCSLQ